MADLICMGLFELLGVLTDNYKIKKSCPQSDSNPGPSAYEVKSLSIALIDQISIEHLNVECAIKNLPVPCT